MSVTIGSQGSQVYVELKHGGKSLQIPCKDQNEAQQVKAAAEEAEKKIEEKEKAQAAANGATTPVDLAQSTPPAGVGTKIDKVG